MGNFNRKERKCIMFFKPYLDFWLDLGFVEIRTVVMTESICRDRYEIIVLHIKLFRRWGFVFDLYSPGYKKFSKDAILNREAEVKKLQELLNKYDLSIDPKVQEEKIKQLILSALAENEDMLNEISTALDIMNDAGVGKPVCVDMSKKTEVALIKKATTEKINKERRSAIKRKEQNE